VRTLTLKLMAVSFSVSRVGVQPTSGADMMGVAGLAGA